MYTGTMIDDLIRTVEKVEKTEQQARTELTMAAVPAPQFEAYPASTYAYAYAWPGMGQAIVGVA